MPGRRADRICSLDRLSLAVFGVPLATDNGGVALQVDPFAHVSDWHLVPPRNAFDDPVGYAFKLVLNVLRFVRSSR